MRAATRFAVLGSGAGGRAMAADLSMAGFDVGLFELPSFESNLQPIQARGGIEATGVIEGFAAIDRISIEPGEILENVDVIMIAAPAYGHEAFLETCLPYLREDQVVVFNTGYFAGLRFRNRIKQAGKRGIILAETMILPYTCRVVGPYQVHVDGKKARMTLAALPASKTAAVLARIQTAYPEFQPATNVLETTLNNLNLLGHAPVTLLNRAKVEITSPYVLPVKEGVSPSVGRLIEAGDRERIALGKALGLKVLTSQEMMELWGYTVTGESVYEVFHGSRQFDTFQYTYIDGTHQYLQEDLPFGLVPMADLGDSLGVPMPVIKAMVEIFSILDGKAYWQEGITVEKLGIQGMSAEEILAIVS